VNDAEVLARAKAYPFARPESSVIVMGNEVRPLVDFDPDDFASRTPVLAYGSNASPDSLRWKFPDNVAVMPLLRGTATGIDVVYSAHMTVYGSIPATLQVSPGTRAEVFVALLTEAQLERVAAWEINATAERLVGLELALDCAPAPDEVTAFISKHGCLTAGDTEIALAEIPAESRRLPPMAEPEVLEHARTIAAPDLSLDDFILEGVRDDDRARGYTEALKRTAHPFISPGSAAPDSRSRRGDSNP
jgi:hypothetical protein